MVLNQLERYLGATHCPYIANHPKTPRIVRRRLLRGEATVDATYKNSAQWCKLSIQAAASMAPLGGKALEVRTI